MYVGDRFAALSPLAHRVANRATARHAVSPTPLEEWPNPGRMDLRDSGTVRRCGPPRLNEPRQAAG